MCNARSAVNSSFLARAAGMREFRPVFEDAMSSWYMQARVLPAILGLLALIGLVLLYGELRKAARRSKEKKLMGFPSRRDRLRKAG